MLVGLFVCLLTDKGHSQTIKLDLEKQSFSEVLEQLRNQYGIQFSANETLITACKISGQYHFNNPKEAIETFTQECNLSYQEIKGVFVIIEKEKKALPQSIPKVKRKIFPYKGQVIDANSQEPLPFSSIKIGNSHLVTDVNGRFSYQSTDSLLDISISHIGYYLYQQQVAPSSSHQFALQHNITQLSEIVIQAPARLKTIHLGEEPGRIKLNHQIATFLPGTGNNSIFSLLRLQPGVLAAGEQTKDYILWGSYKGQSQILYDGITIFNTSSSNNEMDAINPLIIKDIEILKGGYNVHIGDRVGGVVNISSHSGRVDSFYNTINLTNQSINAHTNIPLFKHSNLQIAFRTTFPNLFLEESYQKNAPTKYFFSDFNLKYTLPFKQGDYFSISLIGNIDNYSNRLKEKTVNKDYLSQHRNNQYQLGGAIFYAKAWEKAGISHFRTTYSQLNTSYFNQNTFLDISQPNNTTLQRNFTLNTISEFSTRIDHFLPATKHHNISFGLAVIHNQATYAIDTAEQNLKASFSGATRFNSYFKNNISFGKFLSVQPGLKIDLPLHKGTRPYWQPRIDAVVKPHPRWKINLAYGIYNQFIDENTLVDDLGNYLYYWDVGNSEKSELLQSMHYVAGFSCDYSFLTGHVEAYYKTTNNAKQFFKKNNSKDITFKEGQSRSYGVDFYLKTEFYRQKIWVAYTWSKTEERFDYLGTFRRAPHDQRHEFKAAGLFNFSPFFVSFNYVFGSGFPSPLNLQSEENEQAYHRLDIAILYKFERPKFKLETGFSILNILDSPNIRYNNFSNFPDQSTQYNYATPFSPTLFLNFRF